MTDYQMDLYSGALNGDLQKMERALQNGAQLDFKNVNSKFPPFNPLLIASINGKLEVVRFLIARKAKLDIQDRDGWTPLMWAALNGFFEIVMELVKAGAKKSLKSKDGKTARDFAHQFGRKEIVDYLADNELTATLQIANHLNAKIEAFHTEFKNYIAKIYERLEIQNEKIQKLDAKIDAIDVDLRSGNKKITQECKEMHNTLRQTCQSAHAQLVGYINGETSHQILKMAKHLCQEHPISAPHRIKEDGAEKVLDQLSKVQSEKQIKCQIAKMMSQRNANRRILEQTVKFEVIEHLRSAEQMKKSINYCENKLYELKSETQQIRSDYQRDRRKLYHQGQHDEAFCELHTFIKDKVCAGCGRRNCEKCVANENPGDRACLHCKANMET